MLKFALEYFFQVRTSVWNQRGYDLAFKFCSCDCGHGHLRKQLEEAMETKEEKKRKREKTNQLPKLNMGDKGKVSDVKDFSDKFCKKIADSVQAVPTKQQTVSSWMKLKENPPHEEEAPLTEGLAAHTLASFFPPQAAVPEPTVPLPSTSSPWETRPGFFPTTLPDFLKPCPSQPAWEWDQCMMWGNQDFRKDEWSTSGAVAPSVGSSLNSSLREYLADGKLEEDVFESEDEISSDEFSSAHGEFLGQQEIGQESRRGLVDIGESMQKELVVGAMASRAALQNLAHVKDSQVAVNCTKLDANAEVLQLRQQLMAETTARKDAMKTIYQLRGSRDVEEVQKASEAAEWARKNNELLEQLHTMEVKHAAEVNLLKQELKQSHSYVDEQFRTARKTDEFSTQAEDLSIKEVTGRKGNMQRSELGISEEECFKKEGVKVLVDVLNKEMLKVGKLFAESRRKILKKIATLEERLELASKVVEHIKCKGSTEIHENRGDQEKTDEAKVSQIITSVEEEFVKVQRLETSIMSRQKFLEEDFEAGKRRQTELSREREEAMEIVNRLKHVLKTLEDRQG